MGAYQGLLCREGSSEREKGEGFGIKGRKQEIGVIMYSETELACWDQCQRKGTW